MAIFPIIVPSTTYSARSTHFFGDNRQLLITYRRVLGTIHSCAYILMLCNALIAKGEIFYGFQVWTLELCMCLFSF